MNNTVKVINKRRKSIVTIVEHVGVLLTTTAIGAIFIWAFDHMTLINK